MANGITESEATESITKAIALVLPLAQAASPLIAPIFAVAAYVMEACAVAKSNRSEFLSLGDLVGRTAVSLAQLSAANVTSNSEHVAGLRTALEDISAFLKRFDTAEIDQLHRVNRFTNKIKAIMSAKETQTQLRILQAHLVAAASFLELELQVRTVVGIDELKQDMQQLLSYNEALTSKLEEVTLKCDQLNDLAVFMTRQLQRMDNEQATISTVSHASASSTIVRVATQKDIVRTAQKRVLDAAEKAWRRESTLPFNPAFENWMISSYEVQYEKSDLIGRGGSASVYKGYMNNTVVAVKVFHDVINNDPEALEAVIRQELNMWMTISGKPHIHRLIGVCTKVQQPFIVSEFCRNTADKYVRHHPKEIYRILYETVCGLETIHDAGIIHRDLKPFNILITETNHAVVSDFGLSKSAIERLSSTASFKSGGTPASARSVGTLNWMSPEQRFAPRTTTVKSDIWSFAMVAWGFVSGKEPFSDFSDREIDSALESEDVRPDRPEQCNDKLWELIQKCWSSKPENRPSASDIRLFFETYFLESLGSAITKIDWTIFISYCWKNSIDAYDRRQIDSDSGCGPCDPRDLAKKLTAIGHVCWLDVERTQVGKPLFEYLVEGMKGAKLAIVCVSNEYAKSDNCLREFEFIIELKIPFILVVVGPESETTHDWRRSAVGFLARDSLFINAKSRIGEEYADSTFNTIIDAIEYNLETNAEETAAAGPSTLTSSQTVTSTLYSRTLAPIGTEGSSSTIQQSQPPTTNSVSQNSILTQHYSRHPRMSISLSQPSIVTPPAPPPVQSRPRIDPIPMPATRNDPPPVYPSPVGSPFSFQSGYPSFEKTARIEAAAERSLPVLENRAAAGDAEAMHMLGNAYQYGDGITQDYAKALEWYMKAAAKNHAPSQNNIGYMYRMGLGVPKPNPDEAAKWYMKSAALGNADGENSLGFCYLSGVGVKKDEKKAAEWFGKAAKQGNPEGLNNFGWALLQGKGVEKNAIRAVEYFRQGAEAGNARSQNLLGYAYLHGLGVAKCYADAAEWFELSATQGYMRAKSNLAYMYRNGFGIPQDYAAAVKLYQESAAAGDEIGQNGLAYMHLNGLGVTRDVVRAFGLYSLSAEQGNSDAQCSLGQMYRNGGGVQKDLYKAFSWYEKSARQGNSDAQNNLGWMYLNGLGIEKSHARALEWFLKSANQDNPKGQNNVGHMYEFGKGVRKSKQTAIEWYRKAAAQGLPDAAESLRRLE